MSLPCPEALTAVASGELNQQCCCAAKKQRGEIGSNLETGKSGRCLDPFSDLVSSRFLLSSGQVADKKKLYRKLEEVLIR